MKTAHVTPRRVYTDEQRLNVDFWGADRDVDVRNKTEKVVTTRKPQFCAAHDGYKGAEVPAGTRCMVERAVVEGKWCSSYVCVECIDAWLREINEEPAETEHVVPASHCLCSMHEKDAACPIHGL